MPKAGPASKPPSPRRALFLDRDGTLMVDTGYVRDPNMVELLPGAVDMLVEAKRLGFALILVSNQSGVARGIISRVELAAVQARFEELLVVSSEGSIRLDDVRFCLHGPEDGCLCRKPAPGMLRQAAKARGIDLERSVMLGDRDSDILAGRAAGCATTILLDSTETNRAPPPSATHSVGSLIEVVPILRRL
jgi:D-glycero-D-manno-heptose 1,7-bisphosphate phosphatase